MEKQSFPKMVSYHRYEEYTRVAHLIVNSYVSAIYPILYRLRLWDDLHILKYLRCSSTKDIYDDAMRESKERLTFLAEEAQYEGQDFWSMIRDESSPVKSPSEEGFVFVNMPYSDYAKRDIVVSSLSVKNRKLSINEKILEEASLISPTEKQQLLYNLVLSFCAELEKGGFLKYNPGELMYYSTNLRKLVPNVYSILGSQICYRYRK